MTKRKEQPSEPDPMEPVEAVFVAPEPEPPPAPTIEPAIDIPRVFIEGAGEAVLALTPFSCRWPFGDPLKPDFRFCMAAKEGTGPYCREHQALHAGVGAPSERRVMRDMRMLLRPGRVLL